MDNIYEWLYDHYFKPYEGEILCSYRDLADAVSAAEERLLAGGGDRLDRADDLAMCRRALGTAAFAAGLYFGSRLVADLGFLGD